MISHRVDVEERDVLRIIFFIPSSKRELTVEAHCSIVARRLRITDKSGLGKLQFRRTMLMSILGESQNRCHLLPWSSHHVP